eukprot:2278894-Rhodomonas_salina.2
MQCPVLTLSMPSAYAPAMRCPVPTSGMAFQASASAEGNVHSKVATMADAAVHLYGEKQLEMEWEGDQVTCL